jgi:hypothetical protein
MIVGSHPRPIRIEWSRDERHAICCWILRHLHEYGVGLADGLTKVDRAANTVGSIPDKVLLALLRRAIEAVLVPERRKFIAGPSKVPWIRGVLRITLVQIWDDMLRTATFPEPAEAPAPIEVGKSSPATVAIPAGYSLVPTRRWKALAKHARSQSEAIRGLRDEVAALTELVLESVQPARTPRPVTSGTSIADTPPRRLVIAIAGLRHKQKEDVREKLASHLEAGLKIVYVDDHRATPPGSLRSVDHIFIMDTFSNAWAREALRIHGERASLPHGFTNIVRKLEAMAKAAR